MIYGFGLLTLIDTLVVFGCCSITLLSGFFLCLIANIAIQLKIAKRMTASTEQIIINVT